MIFNRQDGEYSADPDQPIWVNLEGVTVSILWALLPAYPLHSKFLDNYNFAIFEYQYLQHLIHKRH